MFGDDEEPDTGDVELGMEIDVSIDTVVISDPDRGIVFGSPPAVG